MDKSETNKTNGAMAPPDKIDRYQFYFETPLYKFVHNDQISNVLHSGEIEAFSVAYKTPTTYSVHWSEIESGSFSEYRGYRKVYLNSTIIIQNLLRRE